MIFGLKKVWKNQKNCSQHQPKHRSAARMRQSCEIFHYRKKKQEKERWTRAYKNAIHNLSIVWTWTCEFFWYFFFNFSFVLLRVDERVFMKHELTKLSSCSNVRLHVQSSMYCDLVSLFFIQFGSFWECAESIVENRIVFVQYWQWCGALVERNVKIGM